LLILRPGYIQQNLSAIAVLQIQFPDFEFKVSAIDKVNSCVMGAVHHRFSRLRTVKINGQS